MPINGIRSYEYYVKLFSAVSMSRGCVEKSWLIRKKAKDLSGHTEKLRLRGVSLVCYNLSSRLTLFPTQTCSPFQCAISHSLSLPCPPRSLAIHFGDSLLPLFFLHFSPLLQPSQHSGRGGRALLAKQIREKAVREREQARCNARDGWRNHKGRQEWEMCCVAQGMPQNPRSNCAIKCTMCAMRNNRAIWLEKGCTISVEKIDLHSFDKLPNNTDILRKRFTKGAPCHAYYFAGTTCASH